MVTKLNFGMETMTRRTFIKYGLCVIASLCMGSSFAEAKPSYKEAMFYKNIGGGNVRCGLCFRGCLIKEGERGFCRNRENRKGILYSLVYAKAAAFQLDPIEKEPMFHNLPRGKILGVGTASCNFRCRFCHNWHLSQRSPEELDPYTMHISAEDVVKTAQRMGAGLSFTYNEPTVFYEFMHDIAKAGRERGLNTIFHTNGGMQAEPMKTILKYMRGVTVDLKGFTADYYRDVSFAQMSPVLETLKLIKKEGKWLEIVHLIIPTLNDNMQHIREMCLWIKENLGDEVPVHFTRFFPAYKMTHLPPTPVKTLEQARETAIKAGIKFVYIGNVPGHKYNSTFCPKCGERIIHRTHFIVHEIALKDGKCKYCGCPIPGLWVL